MQLKQSIKSLFEKPEVAFFDFETDVYVKTAEVARSKYDVIKSFTEATDNELHSMVEQDFNMEEFFGTDERTYNLLYQLRQASPATIIWKMMTVPKLRKKSTDRATGIKIEILE